MAVSSLGFAPHLACAVARHFRRFGDGQQVAVALAVRLWGHIAGFRMLMSDIGLRAVGGECGGLQGNVGADGVPVAAGFPDASHDRVVQRAQRLAADGHRATVLVHSADAVGHCAVSVMNTFGA